VKLRYYDMKQFDRQLNALGKRGGAYKRAESAVRQWIDGFGHGDGNPLKEMKRTSNGEDRIPHCRKFSLPHGCRLVTQLTDGYCILLYCGDHDECDRWLDRNRGCTFAAGPDRQVKVTYCSAPDIREQQVSAPPEHGSGPLYQQLPAASFEALVRGLPPSLLSEIKQLECGTAGRVVSAIAAKVADVEHRLAIHDVMTLLNSGQMDAAAARVGVFTGELTPLDRLPSDVLPELVDGEVLRHIDPTSATYAEAVRRYMGATNYRDWMLFMHPTQAAIVQADFAGPAKLTGVSGSGKTCVVVQRAVRLAQMYPGERVLILTLNRALARLIQELVDTCAPASVRAQVDVRPFFVFCRDLMRDFDPRGHRLYDNLTWKANEHVDEIWQEFYRCETNNYDARAFHTVHDHLLERGWYPERYLREEVDWLRSALTPDDRQRYLDIARKGRTVNLTKSYRERILAGTKGWEDKMAVVGVADLLGLAQALSAYLPRIRPVYRCVLVDEVQDFGTLELTIIRALVRPAPNDLFLCGDGAQAVTSKYLSLKAAGIHVGPRSKQLDLNYRNSREVMKAAYEVLVKNYTDEMSDREDLEMLDPVYSAMRGGTPLLLEAPNLAMELRGAIAFSRDKVATTPAMKACIAICGYTPYELARFSRKTAMPLLDSTRSIDDGSVFVSDLEQTKGFEFDVVCIVNCSEGVLPDSAAPPEERHRDLARLFVAMTRAKTDLVLSWSGQVSSFVQPVSEHFLQAHWTEYIDVNAAPVVAPPQRLEAYRTGLAQKSWWEMTGEEFLFTESALGVTVELSEKLRALVDGYGLKRGDQAVRWRMLGQAADALRTDPRSRLRWGPEVGRQLDALIERLRRTSSGAPS